LLLFPRPASWACPRPELAAALTRLGFIGAPLEPPARYLIGGHFLSQISFLGCSPAIELSPQEGTQAPEPGGFTHVYLSPTFAEPRFVHDPQTARPICPRCGARIEQWQLQRHGDELLCPQCGNQASLEDYRWRRTAARARLFVSVLNVYPREAIPGDGFLTRLGELTGATWDYAYCQCPLIAAGT
jgi:hypothetical protein